MHSNGGEERRGNDCDEFFIFTHVTGKVVRCEDCRLDFE